MDERHNGEGAWPITIPTFFAVRHQSLGDALRADLKTPIAGSRGRRSLIIDETAGSGGDLLPWMCRGSKLGPVIGERTWGGLVGVLAFSGVDRQGTITAPNLAIWTEKGWIVENEGSRPTSRWSRRRRTSLRVKIRAREGDRGGDGGAREESRCRAAEAPSVSEQGALAEALHP